MNPRKKELNWFFGVLLAFILLLVLIGFPEIQEFSILIATFTLTWMILSNSYKKGILGNNDTKYLRKELIWFVALLTIFLSLLLLLGSPTYTDLALVSLVFTVIWIIRSFLFRHLASRKN
ncbi:MAG: hypothetical protein ACTSYU_12110 [Promethearchaeota archaeon]